MGVPTKLRLRLALHLFPLAVRARAEVCRGNSGTLRLGHVARLRAERRFMLLRLIEQVRLELGAMLVEADCVPEGLDRGVACGEGQRARDETDRRHGVPYTDKFDVDVDGEGFFERSGLFPTELVCPCEHFVGEGDLLVIACWNEADLSTYEN